MADTRYLRSVAQALIEIAQDIDSGVLPGDEFLNFHTLHDHVDANEYGGLTDPDSPFSDFGVEEANAVQDAINTAMVRVGNFTREEACKACGTNVTMPKAPYAKPCEGCDHLRPGAEKPEPCEGPYFASNTGRLSCAKHGGAYLAGEVEVNPRKRVIVTPLDHWERLTQADMDYLKGEDIAPCEVAR